MKFDRKLRGKVTLPYDVDPTESCGSLCPGFGGGKLDVGHPLSRGPGKHWREVLTKAGIKLDKLADLHKEMYKASEADPRMLVRKDRPMPGVVAAFARFSPEVGQCGKSTTGYRPHHPGCGAVVISVFAPECRPEGSSKNVAMLYTVAPNSRDHSDLTPGDFLCALRAQSANMMRAVREYNRLSMSYPPPGEAERMGWWSSDLRAQVEYNLSDRNMKLLGPLPGGELDRGESTFKDAVLHAPNGWLDLALMRGPVIISSGATAQELVDALATSRTLELTVDNEGRANIRRKNLEYLFCAGGVLSHEPLPDSSLAARRKRKADEAMAAAQEAAGLTPGSAEAMAMEAAAEGQKNEQENVCWDWKNKGFCPRGEECRYSHVLTAAVQQAMLASKGMKGGMPPAMSPPATPPPGPPVGGFGKGDPPVAGPPSTSAGGMVEYSNNEFVGKTTRIPRGMSTVQAFMMRPTMKIRMPEPPESLQQKAKEVPKPKVGSKVKIHGLVMKAKYNDCIAECESFDEDALRWSVRLGDGSTISVKDPNLTVVDS